MTQFEMKFKAQINALPTYNTNAAAVAAGLAVGRPYWAGANHENSPAGRLLKVV